MSKEAKDFATKQVEMLDQWTYGFMTGTLAGVVLVLICIAAIVQPLR
jgi:hypothetical protein